MPTMSAIVSPPGVELLGQPVSIADIDKELVDLFAVEDENEPGVTRASLLNFALYIERPDQLPQNAELLAEITREAACRSILICVDPGATESSATAWIQAHCQLDRDGRKSVCSEQLSFYLTGSSPGLVRSTVFSHLDSDLPLVFWWRGEFSDSFEERLYSRIDRLIFDSETWVNPRNQMIRLSQAGASGNCHFCYHDLAFTRINPYRQAISNEFEMPGLRQDLEDIESIEVRYSPGNRMSAIYLCCWFASRLGARLVLGECGRDRYVFRSRKSGFPSRMIAILEECSENQILTRIRMGKQFIEIGRPDQGDFLRTRVFAQGSAEERQEDWLPTHSRCDAASVIEILERGGRNRSFPPLIKLAAEVLTI